MLNDTIAALATAPGAAAIGIIRVSGPRAADISAKVFFPKNMKPLTDCESRRTIRGALRDGGGNLIDDCLAVVNRAPASFTGEDTVELYCHGSPVALSDALAALFAAGARQASAGEYTKRAFLNGKVDLTQAEAIIDLISAETSEAARNAAGQVDGVIGRLVTSARDRLVDLMSHFHAVVDYTDEDIDPLEAQDISQTLCQARDDMDRLLQTYGRGRVLKHGVKAAIIGRPNVGKSSLLNALIGVDRAIVTPIAGTTRDTIEEKVLVGGVALRLSDTAGIRDSRDPIERMGVDRARAAAKDAELVLVVLDGSAPLTDEDFQAMDAASAAPRRIAVVNKSDLQPDIDLDAVRALFDTVCVVSAALQHGLDSLDGAVRGMFAENAPIAFDGGILTNARQAEAVARARDSLDAAAQALQSGMTPDAVLMDVEQALEALGEITGRSMREDIVSRIFERFCVGK